MSETTPAERLMNLSKERLAEQEKRENELRVNSSTELKGILAGGSNEIKNATDRLNQAARSVADHPKCTTSGHFKVHHFSDVNPAPV